ncbi:ATP-binding protein [Dokdonia sp. Asnod1-B02]|uniref:ATP-binding protein n=1 Tax=Dokdonia sp. Asnod1-B02 TaxID=3160573 RepID=UPI00386978EF
MLDNLRQDFFNKTIQLLIVNRGLNVVDSDQNLFSISKNSDITEFHPFFYSLMNVFEETKKEHTFFCVQVEVLGKLYFLDIKTILRDDDTLVVILNDLTDHYKTVHQIKQVRNESIIGFNITQELNQELEIQRSFKNKFLANVSHEIRTPLNSIVGFLSVLENTDITREQLDILNIVKDSSKNLVTILDDLMDISKIEAGKLEIKKRRFDFKEFIEVLGKTYQLRADEKRLSFEFEMGSKIPRFLVGDHLRINQILVNLLENALKYTHQGNIKFCVKTDSQNARRIPVTFEVTDTGIGIPKEKIDSIFDSFTQLEKRGLFGGSGLGLSIVKQLTHLLESDLEVSSVEGKGSTFSFTVYMGVSHNQKREKKEKTKKTKNKKAAGKKPRILLGEDVEVNQLLMLRLFVDHGAYSIDIAKDGERVLEFLDRNTYDLVILDLTMPIMDGLDTAVQIRSHSNSKISKLPIIALTARTAQEEQDAAKEAGMNAYLTKPIDAELLFETIERLLTRYKRKSKEVLSLEEEEE